MELWHRARCLHPISWWEFGAAAGSTLGIFALLSLAADPLAQASTADRIVEAYFPYVCGLHIMLDYLIDREEDRLHDDLNFTAYYGSPNSIVSRMIMFFDRAEERLGSLDAPAFHHAVLRGLPALYLSDPKAISGGLDRITRKILKRAGPQGARFSAVCRFLRSVGAL